MTDSDRHPGLVPGATPQLAMPVLVARWTPARGRGDGVCVAVEAQNLLGISREGSMG